MAIEAKSKEIDGVRVVTTQFAGRRGFKLKAKLIKLVGPGIFSILKSVTTDSKSNSKDPLDADINMGAIGQALESLVSKLSEDQWLDLVEELLEATTLNDQEAKLMFDLVFAANYATLYKVIGFVLEVNYGSFLGDKGIGGMLEKFKQKSVSKKR